MGIEAGECSSALEAVSVLRISQQIHGHVFDDGHVFGAETIAQERRDSSRSLAVAGV
jgi:hypothetical protein